MTDAGETVHSLLDGSDDGGHNALGDGRYSYTKSTEFTGIAQVKQFVVAGYVYLNLLKWLFGELGLVFVVFIEALKFFLRSFDLSICNYSS